MNQQLIFKEGTYLHPTFAVFIYCLMVTSKSDVASLKVSMMSIWRRLIDLVYGHAVRQRQIELVQ